MIGEDKLASNSQTKMESNRMRVAIIGKGNVGKALAPNIAAAGYDVIFGVRDPQNPKYSGDGGIPLKTVG